MTKLLKLILLLSLSLYSIVCLASPVDELIARLTIIKTFKANFQQKVFDGNELLSQERGKIYIETPKKLRWEVLTPNNYLLLANQEKIWQFDPELEQVIVQEVNKVTNYNLLTLLLNDGDKIRNYFLVYKIACPGMSCFRIVAKDSNSGISKLEIKFTEKAITNLNIVDSFNNKTEIIFQEIQLNIILPEGIFDFIPPKGVDVIDST